MTPGKVTVYDVAGEAGVSIATVSRVLRDHPNVADGTRDRVKQAIDALGWRPNQTARALAGKTNDAIGIVFPDLSGPYYAEVIRGFERTSGHRSAVHILATHERPSAHDHVRGLAERVDGMVVMGQTVDDELVAELVADGLPVVLLARPAVGSTPVVATDNAGSARALADHLVDHGHDTVALLGDPDHAPDVEERFTAMRGALEARDVDPGEPILTRGFEVEDGAIAMIEAWEAGRRPRAVMAANDQLAAGIYRAADAIGLAIGTDLAVTGWDDHDLAGLLHPGLTTVAQPMRTLGTRAANAVLTLLAGGQVDSVVLETELVVRDSCGPDCPLAPPLPHPSSRSTTGG
ncbi:LacI family DNA-binding transcriptional regulator [Salsipaludibacter albus]|uniref:LacI family DNA-binding transcriptional regulator n=1 Tax=Salsipaludibacter albus TaxID=2849650 RepID=UPI001EE3B35F|nr:LacI family transcriptional regulator [Salsipaludibacter albus]